VSAAERAHATLVEHCSEAQRAATPRELRVVVQGREYQIEPSGPVAAVVRSLSTYRAFPMAVVNARRAVLPAADCMLAAKLLLEADETAFILAARRCGVVWLD